MCYSAIVEADIKVLTQTERVVVDLAAFEALFEARLTQKIDIPKALETNFNVPRTPKEQRIRELIETYRTQKTLEHQEGIAKQTERLADVERRLAKKESKSGLNEKRIATDKLSWHQYKMKDLQRVERKDNDNRIYPQWYAPVIVQEGNERLIRPMRYHCRPEDKPEFMKNDFGKLVPFEVALDGCYNARRSSLEGFWKKTFGRRHGYMVITSFFENVELHKFEHRELAEGEKSRNLIVHFNPKPQAAMRVACLWAHIDRPGRIALESFAAITDEPPPEVSAAGHDRILIPLNEDALEVWLRPSQENLAEQYAALDNRVRPYYEHKLAA